jgi:hypothetical protein
VLPDRTESYRQSFHPLRSMARNNKSEWPAKVLALVRGGNIPAAVAQIKVAPTVGDITRLQALLAQLPSTPALVQLNKVVEEERALLAAPRLHRAP